MLKERASGLRQLGVGASMARGIGGPFLNMGRKTFASRRGGHSDECAAAPVSSKAAGHACAAAMDSQNAEEVL